VFLVALVLLLTGSIGQSTWATITLTVYGTYSASNVAEKGIDRLSRQKTQSMGQG